MSLDLLGYLWIPALLILLVRFALLGDALIRWIYNPSIPGWQLLFLVGSGPVWRRLFQFSLDFLLTIVFGAAARLLIPGGSAAAGGVGAFTGLMISFMISGAGPYTRHVRESLSSRTPAS